MTAPEPAAGTGAGTAAGAELHRELRLARRLLLAAAIATLAALPFLALLLLVRTGYAPLASVDADVAAGLNGWVRERPALGSVLKVLADVTSPWVFRLLVLLAGVVLWRRGRRRLATWAVVTMAVGGALGLALKILVGRARPVFDEPVAAAPGLSFPSGHAVNSMLGAALLLIVVLPVLGRIGRVVAWATAVTVVLVTGFDRVGLGVHYVSDVLGGWTLALAVLVGTVTAFGTWRQEHPAVRTGRQPERVQRQLRATLTQGGWVIGRGLLAAGGLVVLMVALGLLITDVLHATPALRTLDELPARLAENRTPTGITVSNALSRLADTPTILATMVVACGVLRRTLSRWRDAAFVVLAVTLQALVFVVAQAVVSGPRPQVVQLDIASPTSSFPSGHTGAAVALYASLAVVLLCRTRGRTACPAIQLWFAGAGAGLLLCVPVAVAWSRLYRGMHFPLDVAAAFVLGGLAIGVSYRLVLAARLPEHLGALLDGPTQSLISSASSASRSTTPSSAPVGTAT